jgi:hypothetical protein
LQRRTTTPRAAAAAHGRDTVAKKFGDDEGALKMNKQQREKIKAIRKAMTPEQQKAEKKMMEEFVRTGRVGEPKEAKK